MRLLVTLKEYKSNRDDIRTKTEGPGLAAESECHESNVPVEGVGTNSDDSDCSIHSIGGDVSDIDSMSNDCDISKMYANYEGSDDEGCVGSGGNGKGQDKNMTEETGQDENVENETMQDGCDGHKNLNEEELGEFNERAVRDDDLHSLVGSDSKEEIGFIDFRCSFE